MRRQQRETYSPEGNLYLPFLAAIFVHLVVMALFIVLPSKSIQPASDQVVAVNLNAMPAPAQPSAASSAPPPEPKPVKEKPQPPKPPEKIEATPVKEKLPPPEPPEKIEATPVKTKPVPEVIKEPPPPPKVVSLKPQKTVKKMSPVPEKQEPVQKKDSKAVKQELDKIREQLTKEEQQQKLNELRQKLAQEGKVRDQRKQNEAEARAAEAEAEQLKRQLDALKSQSQLEAWKQNRDPSPAPPSGVNSALFNQYEARIAGHLQSYWKLPDYKDWPPNLLTTVAVTIDKSGRILDVQFKKRSGDDAFDRLVRKALGDADPLPPIPPALKKERLAFTVNYTPAAITGQ